MSGDLAMNQTQASNSSNDLDHIGSRVTVADKVLFKLRGLNKSVTVDQEAASPVAMGSKVKFQDGNQSQISYQDGTEGNADQSVDDAIISNPNELSPY